jgi:hypothetical protein
MRATRAARVAGRAQAWEQLRYYPETLGKKAFQQHQKTKKQFAKVRACAIFRADSHRAAARGTACQ